MANALSQRKTRRRTRVRVRVRAFALMIPYIT